MTKEEIIKLNETDPIDKVWMVYTEQVRFGESRKMCFSWKQFLKVDPFLDEFLPDEFYISEQEAEDDRYERDQEL